MLLKGKRKSPTHFRLINIYLNSLPINPSFRLRQISIVTSYLRAADRGLIAGDFNAVLSEDERLISDNDLLDAWAELHPSEPGYTWGVDGRTPFPASRLDKVALDNLTPSSMWILPA